MARYGKKFGSWLSKQAVCGKTSFTIAEEIRETFNLILNDMSAIDLLIYFVSESMVQPKFS